MDNSSMKSLWDLLEAKPPMSFSDLSHILDEATSSTNQYLIAATIPKSKEYCILSNPLKGKSSSLSLDDYEIIAKYSISLFADVEYAKRENVAIFSLKAKESILQKSVIVHLKNVIDLIIRKRQAEIRNAIVEISYKSNDISSFCHRVIHNLILEKFNVEASSIYIIDLRSEFLRLAATSGIKSKLEKKDIFYETRNTGRPFASYSSSTAKIYQGRGVKDSDLFVEQTRSNKAYGIFYIPIRRMDPNTKPYDRTLGVIKVVNPYRGSEPKFKSSFHCIDQIDFAFLGELVSVLTQSYVRGLEAANSFERTIHGFRADLESCADHLDTLGRILFDENSSTDSIGYEPYGVFSGMEVRRLFEDSLAFLDDLSFQIEKARQLAHDSCETINDFHGDVFRPMLKMRHSIVVANSSRNLDLNNLIESGSSIIPPILGSKSAYISVFRNLLENSIKYAKAGHNPTVRFEFKDNGDFFDVTILDFGIGIKRGEERYLFLEGFRSVSARRRSFRGTGIGLAYSREVMHFLGGDLVYERVTEGMKFIVRLPKAETK